VLCLFSLPQLCWYLSWLLDTFESLSSRLGIVFLHQHIRADTGSYLNISGAALASTLVLTGSERIKNMRTSTLTTTLALLLPVFVVAAPTIEQRWSSPSFWASHSGHTPSTRRGCDYALCDLSKAKLPQGALPRVFVLSRYMQLTHHSSDSSSTTILQFELESRFDRTWHSELHL
jgi:hypothetical protein